MKHFYSNGKLLFTAEYVVLDGALSLALPTKFGQSLTVSTINEQKLIWKSVDCNGTIWFENEFILTKDGILKYEKQDEISNRLIQILNAAKQLNPVFMSGNSGFEVITQLDFPRNWGLGTSSTLINNVACWAKVDAYQLLKLTFGGSGYDIACAQYNCAITYQLLNKKPVITQTHFNPEFKAHLYFVHLNKKQNSREGIAQYKAKAANLSKEISEISGITKQLINCQSLLDFEDLITTHETIIASIIKQPTVKQRLFNDFEGSIKSLGAWGGDFILVASKMNPVSYFKNKGFDTIVPFEDMLLEEL